MAQNTFDNGVFDTALFDTLDDPGLPPAPPPIVFVAPANSPPVQYQIRLYGTNGLQTAVFDDWNSVYYYNRVNDFSYHVISISGEDPRRDLFVTDAIVEVWRRNPLEGIPWYREYAGFHRTDQDQITDRGLQLFTSYGRGFEDLLHRRVILYPAGSSQDTKNSVAMDDAMKAYVRENAGPSATVANGRLRDGVTLGLAIANNSSQGNGWSGSNAWKNLLTALQEMSKASNQDFWVDRTGPLTFQFDTAWPRRGVDRSGLGANAPVVFSLAHDNMSAPFGVLARTDEVNVVIVLGSGTEAARTHIVRSDTTAANASPWNAAEKTVDQRNTADPNALAAAGDAQLNAGRATRDLSFTALDTHGVAYGRDFSLGDLVMSSFRFIAVPRKVVGVECTVANGKEDLRFHFEPEI